MKWFMVIGDGMADDPQAELGGRTPLEYAATLTLDRLAAGGTLLQVNTIPQGCVPGSEAAMLHLLGAPDALCRTPRAPLEVLAYAPDAPAEAAVYRANLVTLQEGRLTAHDGSGVTGEEAAQLLEALQEAFPFVRFISGTGYRQLMCWDGPVVPAAPPPHDVVGMRLEEALPADPRLSGLMREAPSVLEAHPVNAARRAAGKPPVNGIWLWGGGSRPALPDFRQTTGLRGAVIAGVGLVRGIGRAMGMEAPLVPGADGTLHTDWEGKAFAAYEAARQGADFVLVHAEAPDELSHSRNLAGKITAIEYFDQRLLASLVGLLEQEEEPWRMAILPDHRTLTATGRHADGAVPCLLYDSRTAQTGAACSFGEWRTGQAPQVTGRALLARLTEEEEK